MITPPNNLTDYAKLIKNLNSKNHLLRDTEELKATDFKVEQQTKARGPFIHLGEESTTEEWLINKPLYARLDRKICIFLALTMNKQVPSTEDFSNWHNVSTETTLHDYNELNHELTLFHLTIKDHKIDGSEYNIRMFFLYFCLPILTLANLSHFLQENTIITLNFSKIEAIINHTYTIEMKDKILLTYLYCLHRIKQHHFIDHTTCENELAKEAAQTYFQNHPIIDNELNFLANTLDIATKLPDSYEVESKIKDIAIQTLNRFEKAAQISFESKQPLLAMLTSHLHKAYYRVIYGVENESDFSDDIQKKYPELFALTSYALEPFFRFANDMVSREEIGYVAMIFGGELLNIAHHLVEGI